MKLLLSLLVAMAVVANAMPATELVAMEQGFTASNYEGWSSVGPVDAGVMLTLTVAVRQFERPATFEKVLMSVSDPRSSKYGQHLSFDDVAQLSQAEPVAAAAVNEWALAHVPAANMTLSPGGDWVQLHVNAAAASKLMNAPFHAYTHADEKHVPAVARTRLYRLAPNRAYALPASVAAHVDFVAPAHQFPRFKYVRGHGIDAAAVATSIEAQYILEEQAAAAAAARQLAHDSMLAAQPNSTIFVVPAWLKTLYQVFDAKGKSPGKNSQAVASFIGQYYSPTDLNTFWKSYSPGNLGQTITDRGSGPNKPASPGDEAELDIQYLSSMGQGVDTTVWYTVNQNTPFLSLLLDLAKSKDVPNLFSCSYGSQEGAFSQAFLDRVNTEFMKVGMRGVSVLIAAGDSGAGGNCTGAVETPDFPASSPWVTTVGGLSGGGAGAIPTHEAADTIGGGGFSDAFPQPSYQSEAVAAYLSSNAKLPPAADFHAKGRGYPDIAAQSEGFVIVQGGISIPFVGGTSCATPTASGIISLLNDLRIQAGKPVLGFLNPFIYQTAPSKVNSFNDATTGADEGCSAGGFPAHAGWDASTGWGSPNYRILASAVSELK